MYRTIGIGKMSKGKKISFKNRDIDARRKVLQETLDTKSNYNKLAATARNGVNAKDTGIGNKLEMMSNYMLFAPDVDSGFKLEQSFYPDERYYQTQSNVAKNSISWNDFDEYTDNDYLRTLTEDRDGYLVRLFDVHELTVDEIKRFITNGLLWSVPENIQNDKVREAIGWLADEIKSICSPDDLIFLKNFDGVVSGVKVAESTGTTQQNVSKKLKRIAKKIKKWL